MSVRAMQEAESDAAGRAPILGFEAVKVFSATMQQDRGRLGERVTDWLRDNPGVEVAEAVVTQSSDEAFHCIAITVFYRNKK